MGSIGRGTRGYSYSYYSSSQTCSVINKEIHWNGQFETYILLWWKRRRGRRKKTSWGTFRRPYYAGLDERPAIEMEPEKVFFFFIFFLLVSRNVFKTKFFSYGAPGKSWKELMENVWAASRTTMNGERRKRKRKCFKMPIFTRGERESSANMYSVRWDLSLRLSVSACIYMRVWRERRVRREERGSVWGRGMKDARFTRFRFAINSGVRTCGFVLYGLRDIILYSHVYIFTPESVADGQR